MLTSTWLHRSHYLAIALAALSAVSFTNTFAATPIATFDHSVDRDQSATVTAKPGDTLTVIIQKTCPAWFTYSERGVTQTALKAATTPTTIVSHKKHGPFLATRGIKALSTEQLKNVFSQHYCEMTSHDLFIVTDKKYSGYIIKIEYRHTQKPIPTPPGLPSADYKSGLNAFVTDYRANFKSNHCDINQKCKNSALVSDALVQVNKRLADKTKALHPIDNTVELESPGSYVEFSGGITMSQLTDPQFALGTNPAGSAAPKVIVEDHQAESSWNVGFAGFMHVHNPNCESWECRHLAISLGIGIAKNSSVSVFIGPSFRLAGKWFLTAGYNWGEVSRLPNGDRVGQPPQGANDLSNLKTRTAGAFFFSFSYSFLNPGQAFFKGPFQSNPPATQSSAPATAK